MKDFKAKSQSESDKGRRDYYRLDDEIMLGYRGVTDKAAAKLNQGIEPYADSKEVALANLIASLEVEAKQALGHLINRDPIAGRYFQTVEERLRVINEEIFTEVKPDIERCLRKVNLSASGVAFNSVQMFEVKSWLEVDYLLPDSNIAIHSFGQVVRCRLALDGDGPPGSYAIAVDMPFLSNPNKDFIVTAMLERQSKQIREQKEREFDVKNRV